MAAFTLAASQRTLHVASYLEVCWYFVVLCHCCSEWKSHRHSHWLTRPI